MTVPMNPLEKVTTKAVKEEVHPGHLVVIKLAKQLLNDLLQYEERGGVRLKTDLEINPIRVCNQSISDN